MSSRPVPGVLVLMALGTFLVVPASGQNPSVGDLLIRDEIQEAENILNKQPKTATNVAFRGEIEFRRGHFDQADALYREALKLDAKDARTHFGLGKLALGRVKTKVAVQEFKRAVELDPKEPIYHLYAGEAFGLDKKYTEQRKQLEEYLKLNPNDEDRVTEAKAGLETLKAFGSGEMGV